MTEATGQNAVMHFGGDEESFQPRFQLAGVRAGRRHQAIAEGLLAAERDRTPIPGPSEQWPEADAGDAYAVQLLGVSARLAAGATLVGHKVGLTSRAMQRRLGIDHPTYGHLLDRMVIPEGDPYQRERCLLRMWRRRSRSFSARRCAARGCRLTT